MSVAHLSDVDGWRNTAQRPTVLSSLAWGPVSDSTAVLLGSAHGVKSVCITPKLSPFLAAAALGCIPADVRPKFTDSAESLAECVGRSAFLDDAHVLRGGNGKRKRGQAMRVRLNATAYSAPRRKSWSVVVEPERVDADGDSVLTLYNYNAYGRTADDVRCAAMPRPVFDLGVELWLAAMPYLCEESRCSPPTHCQLLLYYSLFESAMGEATPSALLLPRLSVWCPDCPHLDLGVIVSGRHHDNYTIHHTRARLEGLDG